MEVFTENARQTYELGQKFTDYLIKNSLSVLALTGDLGAGKTVFISGLAVGLGIKGRILSPTFILMREYPVERKDFPFRRLYHVDLYRINSEKDIDVIGLREILADPTNLVVIEWAEKMSEDLPEKRVEIKFEYVSPNKRKITIPNYSNS